MTGESRTPGATGVGSLLPLLKLHVPDEPARCGRCGHRAEVLYHDGCRHLCDACFDRALSRLRNLPSGKGLG
jgi:hypothetical protein